MNVLIKMLCRSIVGVFTLGLLGCGCLFPYKSNTLTNQYIDLYAEAESLKWEGEYRAAVEKYEQAFKIRPRSRKVIHVSYVARFKYCIAFCYAKVAETEADVSFYIKAEDAVKESYQTAILQSDQAEILYLWGYILFKQARYEEARAKYEALLEISLQRGFHGSLFKEALSNLEKTYVELGDEAAVPRAFKQFTERLERALQNRVSDPLLEKALSNLGEMYLELEDETAARRIFGQLEELLEITSQSGEHARYLEYALYVLGEGYLKLGEETAARRIFERIEELLERSFQNGGRDGYLTSNWYRLGEVCLELGDEVAARRIFGRIEELLELSLQSADRDSVFRFDWNMRAFDWYRLGEAYLELGDEVAARRVYRQLLENFSDLGVHLSFKDEMEKRFLGK